MAKDYICDICGNKLSNNYRVESLTFPSLSGGGRSIDLVKLYVRRTKQSYQGNTISCQDEIQCVKFFDICTPCLQAALDALDKRNPNLKPPAPIDPTPSEPSNPTPDKPTEPTDPENPGSGDNENKPETPSEPSNPETQE